MPLKCSRESLIRFGLAKEEDEGGALGSFWGFVAINFELPGDQSESRANDIRACTLSVSRSCTG